jgi:hypothetical protein
MKDTLYSVTTHSDPFIVTQTTTRDTQGCTDQLQSILLYLRYERLHYQQHIYLTFSEQMPANTNNILQQMFICIQTTNFMINLHAIYIMHLIIYVSAFVKLRKATIGFVMSVCPSVRPSAWNNSAPTQRIFMKFDI